MAWVKGEGGGWTDTLQQRKWEDVLDWEFKVFLYCNHLYYHDADFESPLPDHVYDAVVRVLEDHHDELPEWFREGVPKGKIKEMAHAIELEDDEIKEARAWANGIKEIKAS